MEDSGTRPWELIGGHPALDFVNTVSWRLDPPREIDRLTADEILIDWMYAAELIGADQAKRLRMESGSGGAATGEARELREDVYEVLHPLAVGAEPDPADVRRLRDAITGAFANAEMTSVVPLRWSVRVERRADLLDVLALSVWRLLETEQLGRLKQCQDGDCGWLFLDRSKNGSRRWCSSSDCGNRSRARRHYRRSRETQPTT